MLLIIGGNHDKYQKINEIIKDPVFNTSCDKCIKGLLHHVPFDPDNTDYQEYFGVGKDQHCRPRRLNKNMSEIRVTSVIGENGNSPVNFTKLRQ